MNNYTIQICLMRVNYIRIRRLSMTVCDLIFEVPHPEKKRYYLKFIQMTLELNLYFQHAPFKLSVVFSINHSYSQSFEVALMFSSR